LVTHENHVSNRANVVGVKKRTAKKENCQTKKKKTQLKKMQTLDGALREGGKPGEPGKNFPVWSKGTITSTKKT